MNFMKIIDTNIERIINTLGSDTLKKEYRIRRYGRQSSLEAYPDGLITKKERNLPEERVKIRIRVFPYNKQ